MESKPLKDLAEQLRGLAKLAESNTDNTPTPAEKLDSGHVLNFIRFFGCNDKGV